MYVCPFKNSETLGEKEYLLLSSTLTVISWVRAAALYAAVNDCVGLGNVRSSLAPMFGSNKISVTAPELARLTRPVGSAVKYPCVVRTTNAPDKLASLLLKTASMFAEKGEYSMDVSPKVTNKSLALVRDTSAGVAKRWKR